MSNVVLGQANKGRKLLSAFLAILMLFGIVAMTGLGAAKVYAAEQVIVKWDFNDSNQVADGGISVNMDKVTEREAATNYYYYAGSDGGMALASTNWVNGSGLKYWVVSFNSTGCAGMKLSSKQRSSATGPQDFKVQYSLNNVDWTDVSNTTLTVGTSFNSAGSLDGVSLPAEVENQPVVYLRWIMTTNEAADPSKTLGTAGTNRIDEIVIDGESSVPDGTSPTELSHTPDEAANDALTLPGLAVQFDEYIQAGSGIDGVTIYQTNAPEVTVGGISCSISGDTLTITHDQLENGMEYTVNIPADAVQDTAGNALTAPVNWSFTTIGLSDIEDIDAIDPVTGDPVIRGQNAAVRGAVLVGKGVLDANKTIYIQDSTQGVSVYCYDGIAADLAAGDEVYVEGKLTSYMGLTEIQPSSAGVLKREYGDITMPDPESISIADLVGANAELYEGKLVTLTGTVADIPDTISGDGYNVVIADELNNQITMRVMFNTGINVTTDLAEGVTFNFIGVIGQYDTTSPYLEGYQLFPRSVDDIIM